MGVFDLVAKITLDTSEFESKLSGAENLASNFGGALKSGIGTAVKAGVAAVGAATTAVTAFAKQAVDVGANFDSAVSQVSATMGENAHMMIEYGGQQVEAIDAIREKAAELGNSTVFSASQAADGFNILAMAGYDAKTAIDTLPGVLELAAAGGLDIAQAADYATGIIAGFSRETLEAGRVGDVLATVASSAKGDVASFGEGLSTVAGMATTTGQKMDNMAVALGILGNNNVAASEAGNALSRTLKNLYQPTDASAKAMKELGVSAYYSDGTVKPLNMVLEQLNGKLDGMSEQAKNQVLSQIFDSATLKTVPALLNGVSQATENGKTAWENLTASIKGADGAAHEMMLTQTNNLEGARKGWESAVEGFQIAVADKLMPSVTEFVTFGTQGLQSVTAAFKEGGLEGAMDAFGQVLSDGIVMITDNLPMMVEAGMQLLSALAEGIITNIPQITEAALQIIVMLSEYIIQSLPNILQTGVDILMTLNQGIVEALPTLMTAATQAVLSLLQYLIENLPQIIEAGTQAITTLTQGLVEALPALIPAAYEAVLTLVMALIENVDQLIPAALQLITALVQGLIEALPVLIEYVPEIIIAIVDTLVENFPLIMDTALELLIAFGEALIDNVDEIINAVNEVNEEINAKFKEIVDKALSWGADLISNFVDGLKQKWNQLKDSVTGIADHIKGLLGHSHPTEGPMADDYKWMPDMMQLFAQGITDNIPLVEDSINRMGSMISKKMKFSVSGDFERMGESMRNAVNMTADIGGTAFGSTTQAENDILHYILQMMVEYFPDFAKNKGMNEADIYTIMNRQMGMAVAQ